MLTTPKPIEATLLDCCISGFKHHCSSVGIYAADTSSYDVFNSLFEPIILDYHRQTAKNGEPLQKDTDWGSIRSIENMDPNRKYILSTRIRIARNLEQYPLFPKLKENDYTEIESHVTQNCTLNICR